MGTEQTMHVTQEVLTSKEAALYIDVSIRQLYRLTSTKRIPFYNPTGGKLYFRIHELDEWLFSSPTQQLSRMAPNDVSENLHVIDQDAPSYIYNFHTIQ